MTRENKLPEQNQAVYVCRSKLWIAGVIVLLLVMVEGSWHLSEAVATAGQEPSTLIGQWVRTDGGYTLALSDPVPNGLIKATYSNPKLVYVSRAEWASQDGQLGIFIELSDVNYPGSSYTLIYSPAIDRLVGVYFQAALRQQFQVEFVRGAK